MSDMSVAGMMKRIIPITRFNKGEAAKIFDEVENTGAKIVVKNNVPACVLLSPEQYDFLIEMVSDYMLYLEAENRISQNSDEVLSREEVMHNLGISSEELDDIEVEIE